jgi:hypothetical protein
LPKSNAVILISFKKEEDEMTKNVGNADAVSRYIFGIFLLWFGLLKLSGLGGNITGILVAIFSLMPFTVATTRKCTVFSIFKISSIPKNKKWTN